MPRSSAFWAGGPTARQVGASGGGADAATVPRALRSGLSAALVLVRRRDPALLGVLCAWGFDIAALWASFRAFGHSPPGGVLVMSYYVGTLANALPLPGGIGGVEGGMIGAFLAFGVNAALVLPSSRIARSPTGCPRFRAPSPTSSCATRWPAGGHRPRIAGHAPRSCAKPRLRRRPDADQPSSLRTTRLTVRRASHDCQSKRCE